MTRIAQSKVDSASRDEAIMAIKEALARLGFPVNTDQHLKDTPRRFVDALIEMTTPENFNFTTFEQDEVAGGKFGDTGIVIVRKIPFTSVCAHHLAPFVGTATIAYVPKGKLVGLSKLARTLSFISAGLQVQERIGQEVADYLVEALNPEGVAVILKAEHTCMTIRGARAHGSETITSTLRGVFYTDAQARSELMQLINM